MWTSSQGGTSPIIADGVLFYAAGNFLSALNSVTGALPWSDSTFVGGIHWQSPVVANGIVYIADSSGNLTAYSL